MQRQPYSALPHLRTQLADQLAAGNDAEARRLERTIAHLTGAARRDAAQAVRERDEAKDRFQQLVRRIRELQGSLSEVPSGREGRKAEIRRLTARALEEKSRHTALNGRVRELKQCLTGPERPAPQTRPSGQESGLTRADSGSHRWRIPILVAAIVVILAAGLLVASLILDRRTGSTPQDELDAIPVEANLDQTVRNGAAHRYRHPRRSASGSRSTRPAIRG